ncbi:MAG TPA: ABC-2 family transporter protein [Fimbriimonadaceae bacterium]|nr:ABC-2 family transporter protein [Fimbriimonadaceae bacterium]
MVATLHKWRAIFGIYFQDGIAYRASGLIWILTDLVTAVTMPLVWASASKSGNTIQGFSTGNFVLYYLCLLLLGSFITTHIMWDLAMEIKEGQFSTALLRPISYYQVTFFRNISWRIIRTCLFLPFFFLLLWAYRGYLSGSVVFLGPQFWLSLILGHLVSFTTVMMMAMIALFTQEAMSIFEIYYVPMLFLSGQLFPIAVLPHWAQLLGKVFPFYYTTGAPTEILIGRVTGVAAWQTIGAQVAWVVVAYVVSRILWVKGLKYYTGVGM